jgi:hypothetical protein
MALVLTEQRYGHYGSMCVVFLVAWGRFATCRYF